ncbi:MAG: hypothetical protein FWG42_06340 [Clostridiales bacterium]|nr:hypothetical protein [Clostridiales bacterium]
MKIVPENIVSGNRNIARKQNPNENRGLQEAAAKPEGRDKITIAPSRGSDIPDAQFIAQLRKNIVSEIMAGAPEYKLDDLRQQAALGEYDVNIPDIIRKMLLDSHEVNHE